LSHKLKKFREGGLDPLTPPSKTALKVRGYK